MKKDKNKIKLIAIIAIAILIVSLIPIAISSFYNHPIGDDYDYSLLTFNAVRSGDILNIIPSSFKMIAKMYKTWQGTYSAAFVMSLQPSIWHDDLYCLGTIILLFSFLTANFLLLKELLCKRLKLDKYRFLIIYAIVIFMSIQTLPSLAEGYFWWNGSCYYTLFYSFQLVELALILKYNENKDKNKKLYYLICALAIIIAGGNYITALQQIILLTFINIYLCFVKKDKSQIPFLVLAIIGLLISALAPGNSVRAAKLEGMSAFTSIKESFRFGHYYVKVFSNNLNKIATLLAIIFLYKSYDKIKFKFKYPLIFTILTFCIFSAQFTPSFYAQGVVGPNRIVNIIYYSYFWFIISNVYYWVGWSRLKLKEQGILTKNSYEKTALIAEKYGIIVLIIIGLVALPIAYRERDGFSTIKTLRILNDGSARKYRLEYKERLKILKSDEKNVTLKRYSVKPDPLYVGDITEDKNHWLNIPIAKVYHKESVVLEKEK